MAFVERKAGARVGMQYEAASVPLRSLDRTSARCRCLSFFLSGSDPSPRVFSAFSCFPSYEKHSAGLSVSEPANQTGQKEQRHYRERETWNGCPPPMTTCFSFLFSSSSRRRRALPTRASHSHPPLSISRPFSFSTPNQLVYQNKKKLHKISTACTQAEVDEAYDCASRAQKEWARTPLWKRSELLHKAAELMKANVPEMARALVTEVAKPAKDAATEVVRSADLISYTAEEGVRRLGEGRMLLPDSFPGASRSKICLESKVPLGVVLVSLKFFVFPFLLSFFGFSVLFLLGPFCSL